jgi:predicted transcriptional regulator of viral defense system
VEVSSETPFATFSFGGNTYACFAARIKDGVTTGRDGVRVTDTERTVLDGVNDFEKVMGLEELLRCLELVPSVDENKLLAYLAAYGKQILYQKTAYSTAFPKRLESKRGLFQRVRCPYQKEHALSDRERRRNL